MQRPRCVPRRRQRMTAAQQAAHDQRIVEDFNREFPVGSPVWYWKTMAFGPVRETTVRGAAFVADAGDVVCFVAGVSGYVSVFHVQAVDEARRAAINFDQRN